MYWGLRAASTELTRLSCHSYLTRLAPCPVVIVPNGGETPLTGLVAQRVSISSLD